MIEFIQKVISRPQACFSEIPDDDPIDLAIQTALVAAIVHFAFTLLGSILAQPSILASSLAMIPALAVAGLVGTAVSVAATWVAIRLAAGPASRPWGITAATFVPSIVLAPLGLLPWPLVKALPGIAALVWAVWLVYRGAGVTAPPRAAVTAAVYAAAHVLLLGGVALFTYQPAG